MTGKIAVKRGSENVFADLGFARPEDELLKSAACSRDQGGDQASPVDPGQGAAELLALKQPDVSMLIAGRAHKFSLERLLRCVRRLDRDVMIVIRPKGRARAARLQPSGRGVRVTAIEVSGARMEQGQ